MQGQEGSTAVAEEAVGIRRAENQSGAMAVSWCCDVDTHTAAAAKQLRPDTVVRASVELNE